MAPDSFAVSDAVRSRMQRVPRTSTAPEIRLRTLLHRQGLRYRLHRRPVPSLRRTADLVFPSARVAVFVDGCFWHGCPAHHRTPKVNAWYWPEKIERNRQRDGDTDRQLDAHGWLSVRVWEHEVPELAAARVAAVVRRRRSAQ